MSYAIKLNTAQRYGQNLSLEIRGSLMVYNKMTVSREGLNEARCIMVSEGVAHGNSGGPVFTVQNGQLVVIGIVSRKESATQQHGVLGITQEQQQYDQLVPISNMR